MNKLKVLIVGCGNMGTSHARAYHQLNEFEIAGLVSRSPGSRERLSKEFDGLPMFSDFDQALAEVNPDVVSINTYPDTHAAYVRASLKAGCTCVCRKAIGHYRKGSRRISQIG